MKSLMTVALSLGLALWTGCGKSGSDSSASGANQTRQSIQNIGSDTMVNLAQAWAESYGTVDPSVSVEVSGGGSGIGIAALINGTCDIANTSRALEPNEVTNFKAKHNSEPKEFLVGFDALAIYVHPSNPMNEISLEDLKEIYREGGKVDKWSQIGVTHPSGDEIIRVSRQNNSGTYHYFREVVVGKNA